MSAGIRGRSGRMALVATMAVVSSAWLPPIRARAQVECAECCTNIGNSGDVRVSVFEIDPGWAQSFGVDADFAGAPGGADPSDPNSATNRLLKALALANRHTRDGQTWTAWADDQIGDMKPRGGLCDEGGMHVKPAELPCTVYASSTSTRDSPVYTRASEIMHEAFHCSDWNTLDRFSHVDCSWQSASAGSEPICDEAFGPGSAFTQGILFLWQFAEESPFSFTEAMRKNALWEANMYLNHRFVQHPGFLLDWRPGAPGDVSQTWAGNVQGLQSLADPDDAHPRILRAIDIGYDVLPDPENGSDAVVMKLQSLTVTYSTRDPLTGSWGATGAHHIAYEPPTFVVGVDARDVHPDAALSGLLLWWDDTPAAEGGPPDDQRLSISASADEVLPDGTLGFGDYVADGAPAGGADPQVAIPYVPGHVLTGIDILVDEGGTRLRTLAGMSDVLRLPSPWTTPASPNAAFSATENDNAYVSHTNGMVLQCPLGWDSAGLAVGNTAANGIGTGIDFVGLLCRFWVQNGYDPIEYHYKLVHTDTLDPQFPAGTTDDADFAALDGPVFNLDIAQCPEDYLLEGYVGDVQAGWDGLDYLLCVPGPSGPPGASETFVLVGGPEPSSWNLELGQVRCDEGHLDAIHAYVSEYTNDVTDFVARCVSDDP